MYGVMDYAGGGPVEIGSGMSALAYSMVLGRREEKMMLNFRPHNVSFILLGTVLLWFGWLGFNGGSSFGANLRAVMACWNSCLAGNFAAASWVLLDFRLARKWTMVGWCSGMISGLVAATPASGYITPWGSVVLGVVSGVVCNFATKGTQLAFRTTQDRHTDTCATVKYWVKIDDALDIFAEHAVGGMIGLMANAIFGADYIVGLDGVMTGSSNPTTGTGIGGWVIHNYRQFYIQLAYVCAATGYAFVMSAILAYIVNAIPGLHLRASTEAELLGMDDDQLGEFAYDYVEVRRDYLAWTRSSDDQREKDQDIPMHERYGIGEHKDMANPSKSRDSSSSGEQKVVAQGDRHAIKAEDEKKEKGA